MRPHVNDDELLLALDGELAPRRRSHVAQHLDACPACRERAASLRSTMAEVEAFHRAEHPEPLVSPDYRRVRLVSALREAALSEPTWLQRISGGFSAASLSRGLGLGVVAIAVCVAFVATRPADTPAVGRVDWDPLPESSLTPGAVSALTAAELCNGVRPPRLVTEAVRRQVVRAYRMEQLPAAAYELDALITPELGGSTDPANLWPQRYHSPVWNAHVKDALERLLPEMVCSQQISLAEAQRVIAADWVAAYKRFFRTGTPIRSHLGPSQDDDAELVIVPDQPTQLPTIRLVSR